MELASFIDDVADFPRPGIVFKDITPLLGDAEAFSYAVDALAEPFVGSAVSVVAGVEARGFLFGPSVAERLGAGFVPLRKPGKLPSDVIGMDYELEYGTDRLEVRRESKLSGAHVLIVDDVLATGGTLRAAIDLVGAAGGHVAGVSVLIELAELQGAAKVHPTLLHSLLEVS